MSLDQVDNLRLQANIIIDPIRRSQLGQFMTPVPVAQYMASLFAHRWTTEVAILDPGAGSGVLTATLLQRWLDSDLLPAQIAVYACEIDNLLHPYLNRVLTQYRELVIAGGGQLGDSMLETDFIELAMKWLLLREGPRFTHVIMNPPYRKIHGQSLHRHQLRAVGLETVNLYAAFVALALKLMRPNGELVAIIPRSFCNGPYYKHFRQFILNTSTIKHIHLFESRDETFGEAGVLQENVIIYLVKSADQSTVNVSFSTDSKFSDYRVHAYEFKHIVKPDDTNAFIHIPIPQALHLLQRSTKPASSLRDLKMEVSTGPVVDFRLKVHLQAQFDVGSVPLLYPAHFDNYRIRWPRGDIKKANALALNADTRRWLFPRGFYTVVRRFSSKEERKRIVASVVDPELLPGDFIGFENHLNVYHVNKHGLEEDIAYGLAAYLNSTFVDNYFRQFNGHTQVNATDLRSIPYPHLDSLRTLGKQIKVNAIPTQLDIDQLVETIL